MIFLLLKLIMLTSIWCLGIKIATAEGMVLERLGNYARKKVNEGKIIFDPLINCEWCLPSIHSLFGYAFALGIGLINTFSWKLVVMYPLVVIGSSVVCGLTWTVYQMVNAIKEMNNVGIEYYHKEENNNNQN